VKTKNATMLQVDPKTPLPKTNKQKNDLNSKLKTQECLSQKKRKKNQKLT
jgi:hypothetical protein